MSKSRLTNSSYGEDLLDKEIAKLAKNVPPIEKIWKITKKFPKGYLQKLIQEGRNKCL